MKLAIDDLCVHFDAPEPVIGPLSWHVQAHTLALIGPSGCGKSTLLRTLAGLQDFRAQALRINDMTVPQREAERIAWRRQLGFVFQHAGLFDHLNALENVAMPLVHVHGLSPQAAKKRASALLERFGLSAHAHKRPRALSGGQQQRVAIARAIAPKPRLLLLDEPTSALDPQYTVEVLDVIQELQSEGLDCIIVTHEMGFARHACEMAAFMYDGRIVECAPSQTFFQSPRSEPLQQFLSRMLEWNL